MMMGEKALFEQMKGRLNLEGQTFIDPQTAVNWQASYVMKVIRYFATCLYLQLFTCPVTENIATLESLDIFSAYFPENSLKPNFIIKPTSFLFFTSFLQEVAILG